MGAYSPAPNIDAAMSGRIMNDIIAPTMHAMKAMGTPYKGVLYAGLMITREGPKLIEYNARFGDPETQVLMPRLRSDLLELLHATATGTLAGKGVEGRAEAALTPGLATRGYPGEYKKNTPIGPLPPETPEMVVFHAGTRRNGDQL